MKPQEADPARTPISRGTKRRYGAGGENKKAGRSPLVTCSPNVQVGTVNTPLSSQSKRWPPTTEQPSESAAATSEREPVFPIYSSPSERVSHVSLTSYPHAETVYWVIPVVDNAFSVEVVSPEYHPTTVGPFATASDAKAWIAEQRQRAQFEETRAPAGG